MASKKTAAASPAIPAQPLPGAGFDVAALLGRTKAEARPYQQRIVARCIEAYTPKEQGGKGLRSVMIESPTGSGKTIMALLGARGLQERILAQTGDDLAIGWISMRRNLLNQAEKENLQKGINARIHFVSMFDKNPPEELLAVLPDGSPNPKAVKNRMLIVDEAQHDAANSMASLHARIQPQYILGMTATPFRTDCVKLCFDTVLKDASLAALIKDGYLAQYHHYTIPTWNVKKVVETYLRDPERWGKSIFYWHRLDHCFEAANLIRQAGHTTDVVTGSSDRERQLDDFRENRTTSLHNCMVLTEGFDCPDLRTVFCRNSCKGVTIQMCGRAFRKHPAVPFKQIVQPKAGWPFVKLAAPIEQYTWERGQWMSLKVNPHINALNCKMLGALATIRTELPAFIIKAQMSAPGRSRRRRSWEG